MAERSSLLPFPAWVLGLDVLGSLMLGAGVFLRWGAPLEVVSALPSGLDLLLLGAGGAAVVAGAVLMARFAKIPSNLPR